LVKTYKQKVDVNDLLLTKLMAIYPSHYNIIIWNSISISEHPNHVV